MDHSIRETNRKKYILLLDMHQLYSASVRVYAFAIHAAATLGNHKAQKIVAGRKQEWKELSKNKPVAWFHCASLGEFEQGRPVIEAYKNKFPNHQILLTFFSPSGYEIRKNYELADLVMYLPEDTPLIARKFIRNYQPVIAFFVKYEFWFNFLTELKVNHTPTYLISGIFREQQHFFKRYGSWFRAQLSVFSKFFVQNQESFDLIEKIHPGKAMICGDTRFDRVFAIAQKAKTFNDIKAFKGTSTLFIAGSTWPADEEVFLASVLQAVEQDDVKLIIAPHEVHEKRITTLLKKLPVTAVRYSESKGDLSERRILIIDSIGVLSHLYQYGDVAYIGGGFGVGIHNTLEAATFGLPVIFGSNYHKFQEAKELIKAQAAFSIDSSSSFEKIFFSLIRESEKMTSAGKNAKNYVLTKKGGTQRIIDNI